MYKIKTSAFVSLLVLSASLFAQPQGGPPQFDPIPPVGIEPNEANIQYTTYGEDSILLDVYLPEGEGPFPVLIWFHPGGYFVGNKDLIYPRVWGQVENGFAVVAAGYSLSGSAKWPTQLHQAHAAVRWVKTYADKYGFDTERVITVGGSAGSHLAVMTALTDDPNKTYGYPDADSDVAGVLGWYGSSSGDNRDPQSESSSTARLLGCATGNCPQKLATLDALNYITPEKTTPDFYLVHGLDDNLALPAQSVRLHEALVAAEHNSTLQLVEGLGHEEEEFNDPENMTGPQAFLDGFIDK